MFQSPPAPLRLRLDAAALVANWRWLADRSGPAACGAAVKADGYGLGARGVVERLGEAGCRDFFVATWGEAAQIADAAAGLSLAVLHGVREEDMAIALAMPARPVLATPEQVRRWRDAGGGACDVMIDTGMNRLGVSAADVSAGLLDGLAIDTLMSHLACADEDVPLNAAQRSAFAALAGRTSARRLSLANSAGICLGPDYAFDLTRPGLALYGGVPHPAAADAIRQVVTPEAQILQRRRIGPGDPVGYNSTFVAERPMELAVVNLGYADGYLRGFSGTGAAYAGDVRLPVTGRVSMDLTTFCVDAAPALVEGDWLAIEFDLPTAAAQSGQSQYELLTVLGRRYQRLWG